MEPEYFSEQTYSKLDCRLKPLPKAEYENCSFINCEFQEADLSRNIFSDCTFKSCNFSMAKLGHTAFRDVLFEDCKMLGLQFGSCNTFSLSFRFENCMINHASFYQLKLRKTIFKNCQLQEADFTESDFSEARFEQCDLAGATFDRSILEKADFRTSYNYSIHPESNRIKKAKFSLPAVTGLLTRYGIIID